jgi:hypothetical protein
MKRHKKLAVMASSLLMLGMSRLGSPAVAIAADDSWSAECPAAPTLHTLIGLRQQSPGAGRECYGSSELRFVAFRATPDGLGGTTTYFIEPEWLDASRASGMALMLADERNEYTYSSDWMDVRVPPAVQEPFEALTGNWVEVAGHYDDPAALTCHVSWSDPALSPSPDEVIEECRNGFALTSIEAIASPCRETSRSADVAATSEQLRAMCPVSAVGQPLNDGQVAAATSTPRPSAAHTLPPTSMESAKPGSATGRIAGPEPISMDAAIPAFPLVLGVLVLAAATATLLGERLRRT